MNWWQLTLVITAIWVSVASGGLAWWAVCKGRKADKLISAETRAAVAHEEAFNAMVDPIQIDAELKRCATVREMRAAERTYVPRAGAKSARIHSAQERKSGKQLGPRTN